MDSFNEDCEIFEDNLPTIEISTENKIKDKISSQDTLAKWVDNNGDEVTQVFGFNENAELVNGRAAMFGFLMLIITELAFGSQPVTKALFGIG